MESLDAHNVYRVQLGWVLGDDDGGPVKDAIMAGLQSLTAGTKSPLSEYNEAFCLLQKRRKIIPVSNQPKSISESPNSSAGATKAETQMITSIDLPSHGQQDPQSQEDNIPEEEDSEVISEVARIIEDLENGIVDPTLTRFGAEDVALEMDDIFVDEDDDNWSDSSSEGSLDGIEEEE